MRSTLLALALLALASSCSSDATPRPAAPSQSGYTLVLLKTGPQDGQLSKEENRAAFDGHFSNMAQLANEKKLVVAGPYGDQRHDATLRGLFVMNTAQRAEASAWAGADPTTKAGVFVQELHDFATDAPLVAMLDAVLAKDAQAKAEGKQPKPGDGARAYVILSSEQLDAAERELAPLKKGGGVFLLARVDGKSAFAVLDAQNVADAQQKFGPVLEKIGECKLDDWFATDQIARLAEL